MDNIITWEYSGSLDVYYSRTDGKSICTDCFWNTGADKPCVFLSPLETKVNQHICKFYEKKLVIPKT